MCLLVNDLYTKFLHDIWQQLKKPSNSSSPTNGYISIASCNSLVARETTLKHSFISHYFRNELSMHMAIPKTDLETNHNYKEYSNNSER